MQVAFWQISMKEQFFVELHFTKVPLSAFVFLNLLLKYISSEIFRHTGLFKNWTWKQNISQCGQNNFHFYKKLEITSCLKSSKFGKSLVAFFVFGKQFQVGRLVKCYLDSCIAYSCRTAPWTKADTLTLALHWPKRIFAGLWKAFESCHYEEAGCALIYQSLRASF